MGLIIGMDEAGLGPNLGPLVITATVWETAADPKDVDFWVAFDEVVTATPRTHDRRLHLADSKQVYTPARGIGALERTVLAALTLYGRMPESFTALRQRLGAAPESALAPAPWFDDCDLSLPRSDPLDFEAAGELWSRLCRANEIQLRAIQSEFVTAARLNRLIDEHGNKATILSKLSLGLLRRVWDPDGGEPTLIIADKHGGRNRYDEFLAEIVGEAMIFRTQEGRKLSCYRVGTAEIRFQQQAESHLPVALASMVCKYVRELAMDLFNRFWRAHVPDLKPTRGYPVDARRFRRDIEAAQRELGIADAILWRQR
ncbi:MAG: hypothetical protein IID45_02755 [Planctomycetes bacterium]|nr:hypothetical protein [Planctomycetota bacterium]